MIAHRCWLVYITAIAVVAACPAADALHARWIPAGDDPLPHSESYRSKLRRLCELIQQGKKLPPKLASRRRDIVGQCEKLASADSPSTWQPWGFGSDGGLPAWLRWGIFIAIALFLLSHFHVPRPTAGPNHDPNWASAWAANKPKPPRSTTLTEEERRRRRELMAARFAKKAVAKEQ